MAIAQEVEQISVAVAAQKTSRETLPPGVPSRPGRPAYRKDIDGLRAVAVLSVMAFHMGLSGCLGGFVGVDVFFVISGYLISAIIVSDLSSGRFSIAAFYERRIRRIFPALFAMLMLFSACTLFTFFRVEMVEYAKSLLAAATSVSNFFFWQHSGYFDSPNSYPLLHTWSLAVEEQFYLCFPLLLLLIDKVFPGRMRATIIALSVLSFASSVVFVSLNPVTAFYMPYTRAWELLLGTLLATGNFPRLRAAWQRNLASFTGLACILTACLVYRPTTPFPGWSALLPCIGSVLVIQAGQDGDSLVSRCLSWRPLVFIGLISYSLYLWHWPIILLHKSGILLPMTAMPPKLVSRIEPRHFDDIIEVSLSLLAAVLSWKFIEQPFRVGRLRWSGKRLFAFAAAVVILCVAFSASAIYTGGFPGRMPAAAERIASYHSPQEPFRRGSCFITPEYSMKDYDYQKCLHLDPEKKNYLLVGDSHSAALWPGLSQGLVSANVMQASVAACRPFVSPQGTADCRTMTSYIFQTFIPQHPVDGIYLHNRWESQDIPGLTETILWAKQNHIPVVLFGPVPEYDAPLSRLLAYSIAWKDPSYPAEHRISEPEIMDAKLQALATKLNVHYISLYKALCGKEHCVEYVDASHQTPIMGDSNHFTESGSVYAVRRVMGLGELP